MTNVVKNANTGWQRRQEGAETVAATAQRWGEAVNDQRCISILLFLFSSNATSPSSSTSYRAIGRALGMHHFQIRRLIAGEHKSRYRKGLLRGLVHYPDKGRKKGCYLLPEGVAVAKILSEGRKPNLPELLALSEKHRDRIRKNGTPSDKNGTLFPWGNSWYHHTCACEFDGEGRNIHICPTLLR